MVANPSDDPRCKTNLILAPLALLDQWQQEIRDEDELRHAHMQCLIHHGS